MASIDKCIKVAIQQGLIDEAEGEHLRERYKEIAKVTATHEKVKEALAAEIDAEAAERKRRALLMETRRKSILETLDGYRNMKGEADIAEAWVHLHEDIGRRGTYIKDAEGLREVIKREALAEMSDMLREFRRGAITGDLRRYRSDVQANMRNVVRELFGESTGDPKAKAMADAWTSASEKLRVRFNEAGGGIGKLEKWGLPQGHSMDALLDYGKNKWITYMMQRDVLDRERTVHPLTRRRLSDDEMRKTLGVIWDRITTDGWVDREVTGAGVGRGALWSQHADHRFLHFKSADSWLAYAKSFGNPDPFSAMMGHVEHMARDIAHMETFGPNPNTMRNYMRAYLTSQAAKVKPTEVVIAEQTALLKELAGRLSKPDPDFAAMSDRIGAIHGELLAIRRKHTPQLGGEMSKRNKAKVAALEAELMTLEQKIAPFWDDPSLQTVADQVVSKEMRDLMEEMRDPVIVANRKRPDEYVNVMLDTADGMWEIQRGSLTPARRSVANVMQSIRNLISSSSLGSAWISSLSDVAFGQDMRQRFGVALARSNAPRLMVTVMKELVGMMDRDTAIRAGLGLDTAMQTIHWTAKENRSLDARAWTGFVADRVLTYGLLSPWTQAGKIVAGLDLMGFLHDVKGRSFAELPKDTQRALAAHGFDAMAWDAIRVADAWEPKQGARYLRPQEIEAVAGRELAERYLAMILREVRFAVPEATVASRAISGGRMRPGTASGELWRSFGQFKGFGIAVVMLHAGRIARELMAGDRSAYGQAATLMITSTILGAVSMMLKDVKDGRDPRKMLDEKTYLDPAFWGAAFLQAGGLGIYGDFLFSNTGRGNSTLTKTLGGPLVDRVDNLLGLTTGNLMQRIRGEKTNAGRELARFIRTNTPGANLLWTNLLFQRVLMDKLQRLMDPEAAVAFRRQEMVRQKDYHQQFWWPPGESAPRRAPDLSRIISTR